MKGKIKYWMKKTKWLWASFFIWALLALLLVYVVNVGLSEPYGKFNDDKPSASYFLKPREIDYLSINANNLDVEVGMSDSRRNIGLFLIGTDDTEGLFYKFENGTLFVQAERLQKRGKLRLVLPQDDLMAVSLNVNFGNIDIRDFRTDSMTIESTGYDIRLDDIKVDNLDVLGKQTAIRLKDSILGRAELNSPYGNLDMRNNSIALLDANFGGSAFLYDRFWQGQWRVNASHGIYALSRFLPYNILLEARSYGKGNVSVLYEGKWSQARISEKTPGSYFALRGKANNTLILNTEDGDIVVEKRGRKTEIVDFDKDRE